MERPRGWYPHPTDHRLERYWDGEAWVAERGSAEASVPAPPASVSMGAPRMTYEPVPPATDWSPAVRWSLIIGLVLLWFVQYFVVVPMWFVLRFFMALLQAAVTVGVWGMLLLFIPVIGWIILLAMWGNHRGQKKILREIQGADRMTRFLLRPWFLDELERRQRR